MVTAPMCYTDGTNRKGGLLMKKFLSTALIVTLLVLPLGTVALADHEEAPTETAQSVQEYIPGGVPAQVNA